MNVRSKDNQPSKNIGIKVWYFNSNYYNPGQNIWNKIRKLSNTGQGENWKVAKINDYWN